MRKVHATTVDLESLGGSVTLSTLLRADLRIVPQYRITHSGHTGWSGGPEQPELPPPPVPLSFGAWGPDELALIMMMAKRFGMAASAGVAAGLTAYQQAAKAESVGDALSAVANRLTRIEVRRNSLPPDPPSPCPSPLPTHSSQIPSPRPSRAGGSAPACLTPRRCVLGSRRLSALPRPSTSWRDLWRRRDWTWTSTWCWMPRWL